MLDFCGQDYNPTSRETDFTRSADIIPFYLIKFLFNAVNIQMSADKYRWIGIKMPAIATASSQKPTAYSQNQIPRVQIAILESQIATAGSRKPIPRIQIATAYSQNPIPRIQITIPDSQIATAGSQKPIPRIQIAIPESQIAIPDSQIATADSQIAVRSLNYRTKVKIYANMLK